MGFVIVGCKLRWKSDPYVIYDILDVDATKEHNQILFGYVDDFGSYQRLWHSELDVINDMIGEGDVILVQENALKPKKMVRNLEL